ncbi:MAG TPA: TIM barrel protein [Roseiflexaceae bacterium]|nr:TIM barrel protein [Roseiflexaceae bacterium]
MIQLGVAVKILGQGGMRARDGRRAAGPGEPAPHLSVSLLYLREVLLYLARLGVRLYRLPDDLAPDVVRAGPAGVLRQVEECADMLAEVGGLARVQGIRLTMHLGLHVALASPDEGVAARALAEICAQARLLDALGAGPEGVLVLHVGGAHGDRAAALERFAARLERLPHAPRARLAAEPDEESFSLGDLLKLHQRTGLPIILDTLHLQLYNPERMALAEALGLALATWPPGVRPKVHVSTQRTEAHLQPARSGAAAQVIPPRHGQHADFVNPFEFAALVVAARGLPSFDAMLEAKAADLALLRLREDLARFFPELAEVVQ